MEIKYNLEVEPICCETALAIDAIETLSYINKRKQGKFSSIAIIGDEELMEKLIKIFCRFEFEDETELHFDSLDFNYVDYEGEYAFILTLEECYDRELTISIEKAQYEDDEYKTFEQDWLYIDEFYEELIKKHLQFEDTMDVFCITGECGEYDDEDDEFECDEDCENCDLHEDEESKADEFENNMELYDLIHDIVEEIIYEKLSI